MNERTIGREPAANRPRRRALLLIAIDDLAAAFDLPEGVAVHGFHTIDGRVLRVHLSSPMFPVTPELNEAPVFTREELDEAVAR